MKLPFRLIASLFALMLVCSCGCLDLDFVTFVNPTVEPEKAKTQRALYVALLPPPTCVHPLFLHVARGDF